MNKFKSLKTLFFASSVILLSYACEKLEQDKVDTETQSAVDNAIAEGSFTQIFPVINDIGVNDDGIEKNSLGGDTACYTVTDYKDSVIIDFKNGCVDELGRLRRGIIKADFNGKWKDIGATVVVTFRDFDIDLMKYEGQMIFSRDGLYKFTRKIQGGKLIHPDWSILYDGNQTIEQTEGYTSDLAIKDTVSFDNVFKFTGKTSGTNRKGLKYTSEITVPIIKKESCKYIQSGIYQITPDSLPSRIINFGDGTCDSKATVTVNGKVTEIKLE